MGIGGLCCFFGIWRFIGILRILVELNSNCVGWYYYIVWVSVYCSYIFFFF